ncbi:hypothetical protein yc1106_09799 [Curvularia clavata]|uniref:Rhodopsin domain-containing protein n=1 Tax=Curvularia clavata TaxID=95742 RepID=A0A9Q9DY10_CURCL|nr:hypothetical protein yc1106_09799 [Curvularia clavata]
MLLWRYINNIIYNPILGLFKISFLITLLKLCCMDRLILTSLQALIVVKAIFIVGATLESLLMCLPLQKSWNPDLPGTCSDRRSYIFGTIGLTIATDILVAFIPAWVLHDLRMPLKHNIAVILFLPLPIMVTVIGRYRLYKFVEVMSLKQISVENLYSIRKYLKYDEDDIEQQLHHLSVIYPYNYKSSDSKDGKDSDSQKQCIMEEKEEASGIQETAVVENEAALSKKELHTMVVKPKNSL